MDDLDMSFKDMRELLLSYSRAELADQAGLCKNTVRYIEKGKTTPCHSTVRKLTDVFNQELPDDVRPYHIMAAINQEGE